MSMIMPSIVLKVLFRQGPSRVYILPVEEEGQIRFGIGVDRYFFCGRTVLLFPEPVEPLLLLCIEYFGKRCCSGKDVSQGRAEEMYLWG